ncbi:type II toxin-antitoxin system RelE/ParE family toxin [Methylomonas koyamae]|uniref:Addiction module toxin RelE n=1 Tax=Methylomonas koyamae TaxID=702114 RepID=A0A291IGU0_9GAMM|nr:type II toxin-antitoxin system RelE/ParE family toxin [Methylomonas koyamae]ATG89563.1 addiction module toxin RelE [Methylomonas koyamae]OAI23445.1 addiction module toxin RelE [Methylomonas koyamae]
MSVPVRLTEPALADLLAINDYYLLEVSDKVAAKIIDALELAVNSLADLNERGTVPKELLVLGIRQYRQLIVKPYRIIYERLPDQVVVHAILDGRRDIQTLLTQRLLGVL